MSGRSAWGLFAHHIIITSCARPQGGSQGGFAATRGHAASPRAALPRHVARRLRRDTQTRGFAARSFAATRGLCRDTRTRAQDRVHVPTTINIEMIIIILTPKVNHFQRVMVIPCPCLPCLFDVRFRVRELSCSQNDRQTMNDHITPPAFAK